MQERILLLFPHQLFDPELFDKDIKKIFLIEDPLFFKDEYHALTFHIQKLMFHRATMKAYEKELLDASYEVRYVPYEVTKDKSKGLAYLLPHLTYSATYVYYDTADYILEKRLRACEKAFGYTFTRHDSPMFLLSKDEVTLLLPKAPYRLTPFYIHVRKKYQILMDQDMPRGGKWTYDVDNRKKVPKGMNVKEALKEYDNQYIQEARSYVRETIKASYGQGDIYYYATTRQEAREVFELFLKERFKDFGPYEDAIISNAHVLFHSTISPYLNNGLLDPVYVVRRAIEYAEVHQVGIESTEGFIRQIIGWREFVRGVYVVAGVTQRKKNYFGYTKKLPASFWDGTTGSAPVDVSIQKVLKTAYLHHIERLMVVGNYMLLNEYSPDEIYKWFMELFIDAYDWVMVPNVYSMITYSDGGMMTTKPYISGANYILKMSDYKKGEWGDIWTKLYWDFVKKHQELFINNPRMRMLITKHGNE